MQQWADFWFSLYHLIKGKSANFGNDLFKNQHFETLSAHPERISRTTGGEEFNASVFVY